jgi:hypothetical protein
VSPSLLDRGDRRVGTVPGPDGVTALAPCWTLVQRQNRPGLVRVVTGPDAHVLRVGDPPADDDSDVPWVGHAACSVVLRPCGEVEVRRRNSPPAVLLGGATPSALPDGGRDRQRARLSPGQGLLLPSCALLEQVPAVVGVLVEVLRTPALAPGPVPLLGLLDALLADVDGPEDAIAVVLNGGPASAAAAL